MSNSVINMEDYKPHITITTLDGNVHVMPVSLLQDIIDGVIQIENVDEYQTVFRAILKEWLYKVGS